MRYCKKCVMPDTRPGIVFEDDICGPCRRMEEENKTDWDKRYKKLELLVKKYKKRTFYDCLIPVSGGKDSYFQTYTMKKLGMNPLLVKAVDPFTKTKAGEYNIRNMQERFNCDYLGVNLSPVSMRKICHATLEAFGRPTWPIDRAIYIVPLLIGLKMNIPLIVIGENVSYTYGGPYSEETPLAKNQIKNNVVMDIPQDFWKDVTEKEMNLLRYPSPKEMEKLEPIYLSYFVRWDSYENYKLATKYGFKTLKGEWERKGYIEDYISIDSVGYLMNCWFKYIKLGHARVTDVASYFIRKGYMSREKGARLVRKYDRELDPWILKDYLDFTGYTENEFYRIADNFYNREIFEKKNNKWKLKNPV